jgi:hypothetical protein
MKSFDHKGWTIEIQSSGLFKVQNRPDIGGCASLQLAKEAIDLALKKERKPIKALKFGGASYDRDSDSITEVTVTSTYKSKWGSGGEAWIRMAGGVRSKESTSTIYLDTPGNRTLMQECVKLTKEARALDAQIEKLKQRLSTVPVEGGPG